MDEGVLNDLLECSVCLERLDTSSRVLPCQHTFCLKCLKEIVQSHKELRCPECRVLVSVKVEELPPNVLLMRILEGLRARGVKGQRGVANDEKQAVTLGRTSIGGAVIPGDVGGDRHRTPHAVALYDHPHTTPGDLAFKRGDILKLHKNIDNSWYQGECNGVTGLFHTKYVRILVELPLPTCKALYDFKMTAPDEEGCLTFEKGASITVLRRVDENWAEGKIEDKIGIFPIAFVDMNQAAKELMKTSTSSLKMAATAEAIQARAHHHTQQSIRYQQMYLSAPISTATQGCYQNMTYSHPIYQNNAILSKNQSKDLHDLIPYNQKLVQATVGMQGLNLRQENPFLRHETVSLRIENENNATRQELAAIRSNILTTSPKPESVVRQDVPSARQDVTSVRQDVASVRQDSNVTMRPDASKLRQNATRTSNYDSKLFQNVVEGFQSAVESFASSVENFPNTNGPSSDSSTTPGVSSPNTSSSESTDPSSTDVTATALAAKPAERINQSTANDALPIASSEALASAGVDSTPTPSCNTEVAAALPQVPPVSAVVTRCKDVRNQGREKRHSLTPSTSKSSQSQNRHSAEILSASSFLDKPSTIGVGTRQRSTRRSGERRLPASYVALFPYKPHKPDELELKKGGIYMVWEKCQDGWYKGNSAGGRTGVFPGNYVMATRHATRPSRPAPPQAPPRASNDSSSGSQSLPWCNTVTPQQATAKGSEKSKEKPSKGDRSSLSPGASLMKRLAAMKSGRVPTTHTGYSVDNPVFDDVPSTSGTEVNVTHVRSGSCPSQLLQGGSSLLGSSRAPGRATMHGTKPQVRSSLEQAWPGVREHRKSQSLDATHGRKVQMTNTVTVNERCRCIVPYPPNSEYELELKVGDIVRVHKKRTDGWYKGTLEKSGRAGLFPASFVEPTAE